MANKIKTGFILGAGLGKRLRPLTENCPKPLLPLGSENKPIITFAFDKLIEAGVKKIIINTHHAHEKFDELFPDKQYQGIPLIFRYEPILLETGGGIKNITDLWEDDENLLIYNGDVFSDFSLQPLIDSHLNNQQEITLVLRSKDGPLDVNIDAENLVKDIRHMLGNPSVKDCLFTGIYMINRRFLDRIPEGFKESVVKIWLDMIRSDAKINSILMDEGIWCDVGTPEKYYQMHEELGGKKLNDARS
jgi:NDP-sugar pyrophosphorylase family protein